MTNIVLKQTKKFRLAAFFSCIPHKVEEEKIMQDCKLKQ